MLTVELPIYWQQTSSKLVLVGLNVYRNWHYHTSNKWKQEYTNLVESQLDSVIITDPFTLKMELYYKNANCDPSNIIPIIEKVFLDALQSSGTIPNDSVLYHTGSSWTVAGCDKANPRCIITLTPN